MAAKRSPQAAWPEWGLAWQPQREARDDRARAHSDRAARLGLHSATAPWIRGLPLAAEGRQAEAAHAYRVALARDPSFVPARRELPLLAGQEVRTAEAMALWERIAAALSGAHGDEAREHLRPLDAATGAPSPAGGR